MDPRKGRKQGKRTGKVVDVSTESRYRWIRLGPSLRVEVTPSISSISLHVIRHAEGRFLKRDLSSPTYYAIPPSKKSRRDRLLVQTTAFFLFYPIWITSQRNFQRAWHIVLPNQGRLALFCFFFFSCLRIRRFLSFSTDNALCFFLFFPALHAYIRTIFISSAFERNQSLSSLFSSGSALFGANDVRSGNVCCPF